MILVRWAIHHSFAEGNDGKNSLGCVERSAFLMWRAVLGYTEILENRICSAGKQYANRAMKK